MTSVDYAFEDHTYTIITPDGSREASYKGLRTNTHTYISGSKLCLPVCVSASFNSEQLAKTFFSHSMTTNFAVYVINNCYLNISHYFHLPLRVLSPPNSCGTSI